MSERLMIIWTLSSITVGGISQVSFHSLYQANTETIHLEKCLTLNENVMLVEILVHNDIRQFAHLSVERRFPSMYVFDH
jgi:hypothetical protein